METRKLAEELVSFMKENDSSHSARLQSLHQIDKDVIDATEKMLVDGNTSYIEKTLELFIENHPDEQTIDLLNRVHEIKTK